MARTGEHNPAQGLGLSQLMNRPVQHVAKWLAAPPEQARRLEPSLAHRLGDTWCQRTN